MSLLLYDYNDEIFFPLTGFLFFFAKKFAMPSFLATSVAFCSSSDGGGYKVLTVSGKGKGNSVTITPQTHLIPARSPLKIKTDPLYNPQVAVDSSHTATASAATITDAHVTSTPTGSSSNKRGDNGAKEAVPRGKVVLAACLLVQENGEKACQHRKSIMHSHMRR